MVWVPRCILAALLFVLGAMILPDVVDALSPTSAEIRLDTGDLRYLLGGFPVDHERMAEPCRTTLLSANGSTALKEEWHRCARFPLPSSNRSHRMCQSFYRSAATWLRVDPAVGSLVAEDVARWIETTNAEDSLPECIPLIFWVQRESDGEMFIPDEWRDDESISWYLREHGVEQ